MTTTDDMTASTRPQLRDRSIQLILANQHESGAYPASPNYEVYRYSWFRDGAFIADAMSRVGQADSADQFFGWCAAILEARGPLITELVRRAEAGETVGDEELLPTRFTLTGEDGTDDWWDFQVDGYGTWLWALATHLRRHGRDAGRYQASVELTVDYLSVFGLRPCYDWWEEFCEHRHTSTLGAVAGGLRAVVDLAVSDEVAKQAAATAEQAESLIGGGLTLDGSLSKWAGSTAVDASLLSCSVPFQIADAGEPVAERTYQRVVTDLTRSGVYRYLGDTFYGGGEWILLTAWLGWYEATTGRFDLAHQRMEWIIDQQTADGWLPEQVPTNAQVPEREAEWIERWGPVATPLLWSHAMFLTLDHAMRQAEGTR